MTDTPRLTHTRGGNDDLRRRIRIDRFRIVTCYRKMQAVKPDRIYTPVKKFVRFLIKVTAKCFFINIGCLDRKRTVKIYRKVGKSKLLLLDAPKHI